MISSTLPLPLLCQKSRRSAFFVTIIHPDYYAQGERKVEIYPDDRTVSSSFRDHELTYLSSLSIPSSHGQWKNTMNGHKRPPHLLPQHPIVQLKPGRSSRLTHSKSKSDALMNGAMAWTPSFRVHRPGNSHLSSFFIPMGSGRTPH